MLCRNCWARLLYESVPKRGGHYPIRSTLTMSLSALFASSQGYVFFVDNRYSRPKAVSTRYQHMQTSTSPYRRGHLFTTETPRLLHVYWWKDIVWLKRGIDVRTQKSEPRTGPLPLSISSDSGYTAGLKLSTILSPTLPI